MTNIIHFQLVYYRQGNAEFWLIVQAALVRLRYHIYLLYWLFLLQLLLEFGIAFFLNNYYWGRASSFFIVNLDPQTVFTNAITTVQDMTKTAFITGINGQDGSYLAEFLIEKGYVVWGILKRNSVAENQTYRIDQIRNHPNLKLVYGDLIDLASLVKVLQRAQPDEIYNLAAQSHVRVSFDQPIYTAQVTGIGTLNLLEAMRLICPKARFYQASSSEMFLHFLPIIKASSIS